MAEIREDAITKDPKLKQMAQNDKLKAGEFILKSKLNPRRGKNGETTLKSTEVLAKFADEDIVVKGVDAPPDFWGTVNFRNGVPIGLQSYSNFDDSFSIVDIAGQLNIVRTNGHVERGYQISPLDLVSYVRSRIGSYPGIEDLEGLSLIDEQQSAAIQKIMTDFDSSESQIAALKLIPNLPVVILESAIQQTHDSSSLKWICDRADFLTSRSETIQEVAANFGRAEKLITRAETMMYELAHSDRTAQLFYLVDARIRWRRKDYAGLIERIDDDLSKKILRFERVQSQDSFSGSEHTELWGKSLVMLSMFEDFERLLVVIEKSRASYGEFDGQYSELLTLLPKYREKHTSQKGN